MNIPDVPRFAVLGKEHKFYMGIGANVKAIGVYDAGNPIADPNSFITSAIPMEIEPGNGGKFSLSAQQSNFYINVVALPGTKNQLGAYVDIAFAGQNYAPVLNHAYLKYRDITAGYTFSIFSDKSAAPTTIDWQGVNAFTGAKMGMISYEPRFGKNKAWRVGVGLDMPNISITNADHTVQVNQRVPNIPFYIQRYWADGKGWLRLSGLVRNLYYRDLNANKNVDKIGWAVKASGKTPIYGGLTAMYQANYGKGVASYIQDLGGLGMDLMPDPKNSGELKPIPYGRDISVCNTILIPELSLPWLTDMSAHTLKTSPIPQPTGVPVINMLSIWWPTCSGTSIASYRPAWNTSMADV